MYALGIITGLLVAILILFIEVRKSPDIVRKLEVKMKEKQEGSVIHMPTDEELAQEEIMRRNDEEGKPTLMSDL